MKKIRTNGRDFIDENGTKITPRGVNMVCKDKSKGYMGGYTDADFARLKSLGMNIVRLGIFWDGVEPEPGKYDEDYLKNIDRVIDMAARNGICVYLDMHQDLYSAAFEDGAPAWATITDGFEYTKTELWSDAYLTCPAVQIAFDSFWQNRSAPDGKGLQDHYEAMWKMIAGRYADNPYVVGYDVLNEPFPGTAANQVIETLFGTIASLLPPEFFASCASVMEAFGDTEKKVALFETVGTPENLMKMISSIEPLTAAFEENVLNPFYDKILHAVRSSDPDCLMMLENNYFSNGGIPSHVRPVCENGKPLPNQVYAPHGYDIFVDTDMYEGSDFTRVDMIFASHAAVAQAMGLPVLVGEWGCYPEASAGQLSQARHLLQIFAQMNAGNTYFEFAHLSKPALAEALKA